MQKISAIVNQLTISENSLSTPLLATKVLASRIKNKKLLGWVNREIEGYEADDNLPSYRIVPGMLKGSYLNGSAQLTNVPLPVPPQASEKITTFLTSSKIMQSCSALEYLLKASHENGEIIYALNGDIIQFLQRIYAEQNPYLSLYSASIISSLSVVYDLLSIVRSKLLDLMLNLESEFGESANIADLSESNPMINNYVQNIYNSGNGNTINTGDGSTIISS